MNNNRREGNHLLPRCMIFWKPILSAHDVLKIIINNNSSHLYIYIASFRIDKKNVCSSFSCLSFVMVRHAYCHHWKLHAFFFFQHPCCTQNLLRTPPLHTWLSTHLWDVVPASSSHDSILMLERRKRCNNNSTAAIEIMWREKWRAI